MVRRLAAGAAAAAAIMVSTLSPAFASGESNIDHVQVSDAGVVSIVLSADGLPDGVAPDPASVSVTVDGSPVEATAQPLEAGDIERTAVLALDSSLSMAGARFEAARAAARTFLDTAPSDVQVGMLTFSGSVQNVTEPTTDHAVVDAEVGRIVLTRGTNLYDAIVEATELTGASGARSVLVLSDGKDAGVGEHTLEDATGAAVGAGVVVDVVAIEQAVEDRERLAQIAEGTGGRVVDARSSEELEQVFAAQADALATQLLVTFDRPEGVAAEASVSVSIDAGGETYTDTAFVPLAASADAGTAPVPVVAEEALLSERGLWLGAGALVVGLAGVLAIVLVGAPSRSALQVQMDFYGPEGQRSAGTGSRDTSSTPTLRDTAVAATQRLVKGDFEARLNQRLNGAGLAMTSAEWLLVHAGVAVGAGFVGLLLRGPALMVLLLLAGAVAPWLFLRVRHNRRLAAFNAQLAETLQLIAGGLSAGLSLPQALDTVVREGSEPMSGELRRALTEQRLGIEIEEALDGVADRMDSKDFSWVIMAIRIQREVGGNLAELLNTVSNTLREREYLRRQVRVLSAEGRFSAWILGGLPIVMFLYLMFIRPDAIAPLYTEPLGLLMSAAAVVLLLSGFFVMSKLVKVEV